MKLRIAAAAALVGAGLIAVAWPPPPRRKAGITGMAGAAMARVARRRATMAGAVPPSPESCGLALGALALGAVNAYAAPPPPPVYYAPPPPCGRCPAAGLLRATPGLSCPAAAGCSGDSTILLR